MEDNAASPASQFDEIAFLYDELMEGVPYREWVKYLHAILQKMESAPAAILDLCCGTGQVSRMLAEEGYHVTGVDISPGMISRAKEQAEALGLDVVYHVQDAAQLDLHGKFDLTLSLFDSLNYILEIEKLERCFEGVAKHLNKDGLFIFDMNTELALSVGMFNQSNKGSRSPVIYNWVSSYDPASGICKIEMDFLYRNSVEKHVVHYQKAYSIADVVAMLPSAGMLVVAVYDAYSFKRVNSKSDRVFFVARKS